MFQAMDAASDDDDDELTAGHNGSNTMHAIELKPDGMRPLHPVTRLTLCARADLSPTFTS